MKKQKGLVLVFTGDGKGKTTAALGVALRVLGHGGRVAVVQFFKHSSRSKASDREGAFRAVRKFGRRFRVWSLGGGMTWKTPRSENRKAVVLAWAKCKELLQAPAFELVIFDEINIALKYGFLKSPEVLRAVEEKLARMHVILTGRGAPSALIRTADLVTEMRCIKHPYACGIPAQKGLDF